MGNLKFNSAHIITQLEKNLPVFRELLSGRDQKEILFRPAESKWCLLEIICHLCDEEREDFRGRLSHVFSTPDEPMPKIDPVAWVESRKYMEQDYEKKCEEFFEERKNSIIWLKELKDPDWDQFYLHPKFGELKGKLFLSNWLAHDLLHIRQIIFNSHNYLKNVSGENLDYAGKW